jgi:tetratricopeptide (TPR) repeat protein
MARSYPNVRIAIAAIVCAARVAGADPHSDTATKLFEEGRDLAKVANYPAACERFAKSYELEPAPGTAVNFADCQEHLGHLARAWQLFDTAANSSDRGANPVRAQYARDRANALLSRLGTIVVHGTGEFTRVTIGGRDVAPAAELREHVDPGDVDVVATSRERNFSSTVHAAAGATSTVDVPVPTHTRRAHAWVVGAVAAGGAGATALVLSGVFGLSAARYYNDAFTHGQCFYTSHGDECSPAGLATVDAAHERANIGTALFVGGAVLVGAGIVLYIEAPREHAIEIAPAAGGVTVSGRF